MSETMEALARRAMACPGWRWAHGARYISRKGAGRITADDEHGVKMRDESAFGLQQWDALPDFSDAATRGCLLGLVREAWGRPDASVVQRTGTGGDSYWILALPAPPRPFPPPTGDTEAEALVAALEAAPAREVQR